MQEVDKNPPTEGNEPANLRIVPTLNFGDKNQLMTRKRLRVILRNFTAISTSFEMNAEAYPGEEVPEHLKMFVVEEKKKTIMSQAHHTQQISHCRSRLVPGAQHQAREKQRFEKGQKWVF